MTAEPSAAALALLRGAGYRPGEVLGAGMEGVVVRLDDDTVAKIRHDADDSARVAAEQLRTFYDAVDLGTIETPQILRVLSGRDALVTVERRLPGVALRGALGDVEPPVGDAHTEALVSTLGALRGSCVTPVLGSLPLLPGESRLGSGGFTASLAALVRCRADRFRGPLGVALAGSGAGLDAVVAAVTKALVALPRDEGLVHGDLVPANVHVDAAGRVVAVLDFGFLSTLGDPAFDAAVAASVYDMYGPNGPASEAALDDAFCSAFGHDRQVLLVYRAAYALATANCYSASGRDGHFAWCVRMLRRPDVRARLVANRCAGQEISSPCSVGASRPSSSRSTSAATTNSNSSLASMGWSGSGV